MIERQVSALEIEMDGGHQQRRPLIHKPQRQGFVLDFARDQLREQKMTAGERRDHAERKSRDQTGRPEKLDDRARFQSLIVDIQNRDYFVQSRGIFSLHKARARDDVIGKEAAALRGLLISPGRTQSRSKMGECERVPLLRAYFDLKQRVSGVGSDGYS